VKRLPLILAFVASACSNATPPMEVGGFPVGERVDGDRRFVDFATEEFDRSSPGHPAVATVEMYVPDFRTPGGDHILVTRSGGTNLVVAFRLVDATVAAFYIGCGAGVDQDYCFVAERPND
jgi:hypothetical protein